MDDFKFWEKNFYTWNSRSFNTCMQCIILYSNRSVFKCTEIGSFIQSAFSADDFVASNIKETLIPDNLVDDCF